MRQKDKSVTTLSKSTTSKSRTVGLDTPIEFVKGVGPKLGSVFKNREIRTVGDLFHFFPRDYEDRSQIVSISALQDGMSATLPVTVLSCRTIPVQRLGRSMLEVRCTDRASSGQLALKWFYIPKGIDKKMVPGVQFVVTGKVKQYMGRFEIVHPEMTWGLNLEEGKAESNSNVGRVVPIYRELEGIPSRTFRKVLWEAFEKFGDKIPEDLPSYLLERRHLPVASQAVRELHFPPEALENNLSGLMDFDTPAHRRMIYGEFFKFEYLMLRQKLNIEKLAATPFGLQGGVERVRELVKCLPFQLTKGQLEAIRVILEDLKKPHPMNRLVQGDVGSGKTAVAFLTAACVLGEGSQAVLLAPTEILAEQHYKSAMQLFGGKLPVELLTGKTSSSDRIKIQSKLSSDTPVLLIGTHAVLEEPVTFRNLSYVLIDEQHRFGVEQRRILRQKGHYLDSKPGKMLQPHTLILTATPIPRTLALTVFADLTVTTITEMPPGRSPIQTQVVRTSAQRENAYHGIRGELEKGRQVYFIFPLVNDSEAEGFTHLKSAVAQAETLSREIFPGYPLGVLHGQLKSERKADVMAKFKNGEIKILVSTTVVEVGVDVPNATIMAIEHSERFGLSQLHQLRGRVGRGQFQSYCYLFAGQSAGSAVAQRLEVLEETHDGFKIAEADLEIRGPGEFLGTRQAGDLPFKLGNLVRDRNLLLQARDDAMELIQEDPELNDAKNGVLRKYFLQEGEAQIHRLNTF